MDRNKKLRNEEKECFVFSQKLRSVAAVRFHLLNKVDCKSYALEMVQLATTGLR